MLFVFLTTNAAHPFYALHAGWVRTAGSTCYTHAMIYSPKVHSWMPYQQCCHDPCGECRQYNGLERKIKEAMCEHIGRILALFEMKDVMSLVLGSLGMGVSKNEVG